MPGRNIVKQYTEHGYYHVYNRGINKETVFHDTEDYSVFLNLFKRYLGGSPVSDKKGREYPWLKDKIDLLAFCLMPNHYHMLIYQDDSKAMTELVKYVSTSYGMYFNKKYKRVGPLFQNRFRAVLIDGQQYLDHISRYIHLNPGRTKYKQWQASSYPYYAQKKQAEWINTTKILEMFDNTKQYLEFVDDYKELHDELEIIQHELADY